MSDFYLDYDGNDYNGGGYDASIAGATVNLASGQPYAALTASGLECTAGSTEITTVHGGFTNDMIGNTINIYSGNDWTFNYYFISGVPDSNTLLVDSSPASSNAVSGIGKVGGAWLTLANTRRDTVGSYSPIIGKMGAGDKIYLKGNGDQNPDRIQYHVQYGYMRIRGGSLAEPLEIIGYNGRPSYSFVGSHLGFYQTGHNTFNNIKFNCVGGGNYETGHSIVDGGGHTFFDNCIVSQSGSRGRGLQGVVNNCYFYNDAPTTYSSDSYAILTTAYGHSISNNVIKDWHGPSILTTLMAHIHDNLIISTKERSPLSAIVLGGTSSSYGCSVINNTVYNFATGIYTAGDQTKHIKGNLISSCASGIFFVNNYSIKDSYNGFHDCDSTHPNGVSGINDLYATSNPFLNSGAIDFTLNSDENGGRIFRGSIQESTAGWGKTKSYKDLGGLQTYRN